MNVAASFLVELKKLRKRPAVWVLALTFVALVALLSYVMGYALIYFIDGGGPQGEGAAAQAGLSYEVLYPDNVASSVLPLFSGLGTALAVILGAMSMGSEYGWDTFKFSLTQRPGRLAFFAGKILAVGAVMAAFCLLALGVGLLLSYLVLLIESGPAQWPPLWELVKAFGAGWISLAVFACLGVFLATLFRGSGLAISLGLVYILALESIISGVLSQNSATEKVVPALPGRNAADVLNAFGVSGQGAQGAAAQPGLQGVDPLQASLVLVAYILAFLVVAALIFRKRDLA